MAEEWRWREPSSIFAALAATRRGALPGGLALLGLLLVGTGSLAPGPPASAVSPGTAHFTGTSFTMQENGGATSVFAARSGGTDGAISATCTVSGGTATAGSDFVLLNQGPLTWIAGNTSTLPCSVAPVNDNFPEGDETIVLTIAGDVSAPTSATITIIDDDSANAIVGFSSPSYSTGNTDSQEVQLIREGNPAVSFTVSWYYFSEMAPSTTFGPFTLSWSAGEIFKRVTVPAIGANSPDYLRRVTAVLANPGAGAVLSAYPRTTVSFPGTGPFNLTPSIRMLTPSSGPAAGGTSVNINGFNLNGATSVSFGGSPCAITARFADVSLTCLTSSHSAGRVDVIVTTPAGVSSPAGTADDFEYFGIQPPTSTPTNSPTQSPNGGGAPTAFPPTSTPIGPTPVPTSSPGTSERLPYRLAPMTIVSDGWY